MRRIISVILVFIFVLSSCGKKVILDETHQFEDGIWMRFDATEFKVDINDIEPTYNISVTVSYDTSRYRETSLPLVVDFFPDSNELHNFTPIMKLREKDGTLRGVVLGNYCTVTDTIDRHRIYNREGSYTYRIRQRTSKYEIYGFNTINLKVERL